MVALFFLFREASLYIAHSQSCQYKYDLPYGQVAGKLHRCHLRKKLSCY